MQQFAGIILIVIAAFLFLSSITTVRTLALIHPNLPSSINLQVPFYTHDPNALYLNPAGMCRFASREMILDYWITRGAIYGPKPSQYTLFVEEAQGHFNETMYYESWTSRGLFVCTFEFWGVGYADYAKHVLGRLDVPAESSVDLVKTFLSLDVPVFAAVAVNELGYPDAEGWPLPNHAIVITGYDASGFYFNNPISLDLSNPACGTGKLMSYDTFIEGARDHFWFVQAAFPVNDPEIVTTVTVHYKSNSIVCTPWGTVPTDSSGYATVHTLKTGSIATINSDLNFDDQLTYGTVYLLSTDAYYNMFMLYEDTETVDLAVRYPIKAPQTKPLTVHQAEVIPSPPILPPVEPVYPYEPVPTHEPPISRSWVEFDYQKIMLSGGFFISGSVLLVARKKRTSR